mmetsp:Transcript_67168/g.140307  ORF Transcript_67168/g.140307 Transcript_67168/m.140307 type:complete len:557 (-) Transcript_67168:726-2396(-)
MAFEATTTAYGADTPLGPWNPFDETSKADALRHIGEWLQRKCSNPNGTPVDPELRKAELNFEQEALRHEHETEHGAAEALQARLSGEMQDLRDQCQRQGHTVTLLAQRLEEARTAVTAELRTAAANRVVLGEELEEEEAQRRSLEAARRGEEAEMQRRVALAERQLSTMSSVRASLEAQLEASNAAQDQLREHIAAERGGRAELVVAGERELTAWSEYNEKVSRTLKSEIREERSEVETWSKAASKWTLPQLEQEIAANSWEEQHLCEQLAALQEQRLRSQESVLAEVAVWDRESEALRNRLLEAEEEHLQSEAAIRRHKSALGACGCERGILEEELEERLGQDKHQIEEQAELRRLAEKFQSELEELQESAQSVRSDPEVLRLRSERDTLVQQVQAESRRQMELREELEADRKSWGFLCMRRKHMPQSPPGSPESTPTPQQRHSPHPSQQPRGSPVQDDFPVGSFVRTVKEAQMRAGEDIHSEEVQELAPGQLCVVLQRGPGRRLLVREERSGVQGWISSTTKGGVRLVMLSPQEVPSARPASHPVQALLESDDV